MQMKIQVNDLSKSYGKLELFSQLCFELNTGEAVALVGRNGSGKSTFGKILLELEEPDSGSVKVLEGDSNVSLRDHVYYIFQNPDNQIVGTVVEDDVAFGMENRGVERSELLKRTKEALKRVGLDGLSTTNPQMLSGGQKQRLAIAGALAVGARFLVLDEPTAMLDPTARTEVMALVQQLKNQDMGILWITHHPNEVLSCDRVLAIGDSSIVTSPRIFFDDKVHLDYGIDLPESYLLDRYGLSQAARGIGGEA